MVQPKGETNVIDWLERTLPAAVRRLMDSSDLDHPLLQLPLAQLRLVQSLSSDEEEAVNGAPMGVLRDRLGVRLNALTQSADRLVQRSLVERVGDASDRRVVRLRLTQRGREWVEERRKQRRERLARIWNELDRPRREALVNAVQTLEAIGQSVGSATETIMERSLPEWEIPRPHGDAAPTLAAQTTERG
jgi:DNA-binding MarR family transcriptional regulator